MQTLRINTSPQSKSLFTVNGKKIWAVSQSDAEWQYEQMQKQLEKMRK